MMEVLRLGLILLILALSGRAVAQWAFRDGPTRLEAAMLGIACIFPLVLLASSLVVLVAGRFSVIPTLVVVAVTGLAARIAAGKPVRPAMQSGEKALIALSFVALAFALVLCATDAVSYSPAPTGYFVHGFHLLDERLDYPAQHNYGNVYVVSFLFLKYTLGFLTALLASGDPIFYYVYAVPVISALITAAVFAAAVAYWNRLLPWQIAAFVAFLFMHLGLAQKWTDIRAETIAWIPALGFLIAMEAGRVLRDPRTAWKSDLVTAMLLVSAILTHGVVAFVALSYVSGTYLYRLASGTSSLREHWRRVAVLAFLGVGTLGYFYLSLHGAHTEGKDRGAFELHEKRPPPGVPDPGVVYRRLATGQDLEGVPVVKASPPYVSFRQNLRAATLTPLKAPFFHGFERLNRITRKAMWLFLAVIVVTTWRTRKLGPIPWEPMAGFAAVFGMMLLFSFYLNYSSYYSYPWEIFPRRLDQYQTASAAAGLWTFFLGWAAGFALWRKARHVVVLALLVLLADANLLRDFPAMTEISPRSESRYLDQQFLDTVRFIRSRAQPEDRVLANFRTVNTMSYLTGLHTISDGRGPYQIYRLITLNARSLVRISEFFARPTAEFLQQQGVRFLVIAKDESAGNPLGDANLDTLLAVDGVKRVFENGQYTVLEYRAAGGDDAGSPGAPSVPAPGAPSAGQ